MSRTIALDPSTAEALLLAKERQEKNRALLGDAWPWTGLVFTRDDGAVWHPGFGSKHFTVLVRAAGLPVIRLHDLRHDSHATPGMQQDAAAQIAATALGTWEPSLAIGEQGPSNRGQDPSPDDDAETGQEPDPQVAG